MQNGTGRREFLKTAAGAAGVLLVKPATAFGYAANETLQLGLIGCGGRGPWLANLFHEHSKTKVVALHDYFRDKVRGAGEKLEVGEDKQFVGIDGYREMYAQDIDAVAVVSPSYFHPSQAVDALEAGKHVYLAKPIAVDAPGCEAIVAAADKHGATLSAWVDFQTRMSPQYQAAAQAIHEGQIGDIVLGQAYYHTGRLHLQTKPGSDVAKLRNWFFDIALSGDIIVEQNIHTIDVANWFLNAHPVKARGTGGRKVRTDAGDCCDHFVVTYTYPNDALIDFSSSQFLTGFDDICTRVFGSEGTVDAHYFGTVGLEARKHTIAPESTGDIYKNGAIANIKLFHESIAAGKPINNTRQSADSTLAGILGRMAAYEGREVTWEEMMQRAEVLDPKLDLPENGPETPREPVER